MSQASGGLGGHRSGASRALKDMLESGSRKERNKKWLGLPSGDERLEKDRSAFRAFLLWPVSGTGKRNPGSCRGQRPCVGGEAEGEAGVSVMVGGSGEGCWLPMEAEGVGSVFKEDTRARLDHRLFPARKGQERLGARDGEI